MNVYIKLTIAGGDTGPFSLYSDVDGFATPFETGISRASLVAGYIATDVPDDSTEIKVVSTGNCTNSIIIDIGFSTTSITTTILSTTATTTNPDITTTTTTIPDTTTTTTTAFPYYDLTDCNSEIHYCVSTNCSPSIGDVVQYQLGLPPSGTIYCGTVNSICEGPAVGMIYDCAPRVCGEDPCGIE